MMAREGFGTGLWLTCSEEKKGVGAGRRLRSSLPEGNMRGQMALRKEEDRRAWQAVLGRKGATQLGSGREQGLGVPGRGLLAESHAGLEDGRPWACRNGWWVHGAYEGGPSGT